MAGSSNYPNAIDNKTPLQDGVDYIEADNVNNAYVPASAIQTFIGAGPFRDGFVTLDRIASDDTRPGGAIRRRRGEITAREQSAIARRCGVSVTETEGRRGPR